ncbi:HK97 gp10 family phage protein [Paenibacillus illinoisensis]|uniref:HK97 gp10 family phage protein n=1 Tax=Paenibacillus illinoisensis TaxID=59845 RepID=UPI00203FF940|nr:HK97 gp10 family phage protein [Paenibacillus illinoisensis]MCM3208492.1 HK97 gp10 family phage protein [Paenibacillus illinoisensis]
MPSIDLSDLASTIVQSVENYTTDIADAIEKEVARTANAFLRDTKALAPVSNRKGAGRYKAGFKIVKEDSYGVIRRTMWNSKAPHLVHLLEFGHVKVNGGRVDGKPHIRPAYAKNVEGLPERIKSIIRNGG